MWGPVGLGWGMRGPQGVGEVSIESLWDLWGHGWVYEAPIGSPGPKAGRQEMMGPPTPLWGHYGVIMGHPRVPAAAAPGT